MDHLAALNVRLSNERMRLANSKTAGEVELRTVWVAQMEREIAGEEKFLSEAGKGYKFEGSEDDLLEALGIEKAAGQAP